MPRINQSVMKGVEKWVPKILWRWRHQYQFGKTRNALCMLDSFYQFPFCNYTWAVDCEIRRPEIRALWDEPILVGKICQRVSDICVDESCRIFHLNRVNRIYFLAALRVLLEKTDPVPWFRVLDIPVQLEIPTRMGWNDDGNSRSSAVTLIVQFRCKKQKIVQLSLGCKNWIKSSKFHYLKL